MGNDSDEKGRTNGEAPADAKATDPPAGEAGQPTVEDVINDLERKVSKSEQAVKEAHDRMLRTAADFENFKKRTKKELDEAQSKGREQVAKDILPVLDNLERALKHAAADDPLAKGVHMVEKQLLSALEKFGVARFSALGQPFDPAQHDAIQQVETTEVAPGTVAQEFAPGYTVNGKLLRPAMVAVAKAPDGSSTESGT